ncbi:hypothetical protein NIES4074_15390 [Cylindrospermum sp. NIES-4074]|nr:hypothetical protein NIES4074_15390 [Cylindrospermum sp. NIES-4074]
MQEKARPRKKPKSPEKWELPQDPKEQKTPIFVRPYLDDYGLDIYEFRILAHVARRASGARGCFESQEKIAEFCGINPRKVMEVLETLCRANMLSKIKNNKGRTNIYRVKEPNEWEHPSKLETFRARKEEEMAGS